jgi:retinoid hydroxylase
MSELPLPPGTRGWPVIGETLAFVSNPFAFVDERVAKHGKVFRTRVLGRDTAVISGPEAAALWLDQAKLERKDSMFAHIFGLFGGTSLPSMDGAAHKRRKQQVLAAFDRSAMESYLPGLQEAIERMLARCAKEGEVRLVDRLRSLAIEAICRNILGVDDDAEVAKLVGEYQAVTGGLGAVPVDLPGTTMSRANAARDRLLSLMRAKVAEHRENPGHDGLARILAAKASDGSSIDDDAAALELHHVFLAGYIVFAQLAAMVLRLDADPAIRGGVMDEIARQATEGPLELATLARLDRLQRVVQEVKRITPMLPILFSVAKEPLEFAGTRIPKGWTVSLALHNMHMLPDVYAEPERFDPDRFAPPRAEHEKHEHAFAPQGPGPLGGHKCPGTDYATWFMSAFTVLMLKSYDCEVPEQDLAYNLGKIPPEPRDGLRVRLVAKT